MGRWEKCQGKVSAKKIYLHTKDAEAKRMKQLLKVIKLVRVQDALEKNARL